MRFTIFSTAAEQIAAAARQARPHEACGLLVGRGRHIERVHATANIAAQPRSAFEIDPAVLLHVHREARDGGRRLIGWYHSHPNGRRTPSATDAARADEPGRLWLIVTEAGIDAYVAAVAGAIEGRFDAADLIVLPQAGRG
jgi:proteasome lid subunit RPN8/RPN11